MVEGFLFNGVYVDRARLSVYEAYYLAAFVRPCPAIALLAFVQDAQVGA